MRWPQAGDTIEVIPTKNLVEQLARPTADRTFELRVVDYVEYQRPSVLYCGQWVRTQGPPSPWVMYFLVDGNAMDCAAVMPGHDLLWRWPAAGGVS